MLQWHRRYISKWRVNGQLDVALYQRWQNVRNNLYALIIINISVALRVHISVQKGIEVSPLPKLLIWLVFVFCFCLPPLRFDLHRKARHKLYCCLLGYLVISWGAAYLRDGHYHICDLALQAGDSPLESITSVERVIFYFLLSLEISDLELYQTSLDSCQVYFLYFSTHFMAPCHSCYITEYQNIINQNIINKSVKLPRLLIVNMFTIAQWWVSKRKVS